MTFIEALAEYHKGKRIRRRCWADTFEKDDSYVGTTWKEDSSPMWIDLIADDWIAEDQ